MTAAPHDPASAAGPAPAGRSAVDVPPRAGREAGLGQAPRDREPLLVDRVDPDHPTHRERLMEAFAESVRAHGYRGTTVAGVVRIARTSRRTFYEHFSDLEACFVALGTELNRVLTAKIVAALDPAQPWDVQVDAALGVYVDECAREPEIVRACERELPGVGEDGMARQRADLEQFADLIVALAASFGQSGAVAPVSKETAIMITGGLRELIDYGLDHGTPPSHIKATASAVIKAVLVPAAPT